MKAARRAFDEGPWPQLPASERAAALRKVAAGIRERLKEIAAVETRDNGKPLPESEWDIGDAAFVFDYYADLAEADEAEGCRQLSELLRADRQNEIWRVRSGSIGS